MCFFSLQSAAYPLLNTNEDAESVHFRYLSFQYMINLMNVELSGGPYPCLEIPFLRNLFRVLTEALGHESTLNND